MPAKHVSAPASSAAGKSRRPTVRPVMDGFVAVGFPALAIGYLLVYLATDLPELPGELNRAQLLNNRTLLPEQAASQWFGIPPSFTLLDRWPVFALAAGMIAIGWLTGRLLLTAVHVDPATASEHAKGTENAEGTAAPFVLTPLERFLFSCGVGLNLVSLYVLAVGLAGRLNRWWFIVPAVCVAALSAWQIWQRRNRVPIRQALPQPTVGAPSDDGISTRWLWLAAPFVAVIFLGGALPPIDFDVREYHLQAPKEFFQEGKIFFLRHNVYGNMPLGSEMFSLLAMVLLDDWWLGALVGKTVIAAFGPLTALALFAAGRRFASSGAGVVAAVLYLSVPWVSKVSTSGLIEGVLAFYLFLSVYAVLLWRKTRANDEPQRWWNRGDAYLALAGFCSGGAVSCKYPAVLFVALPLLAFVGVSSIRRPWKPVAIYLLTLLAGCGLWFAKNWALTGNPVYPLLYEWLGGTTRTADINGRWLRAHQPHEFSLAALAHGLSAVVLKSSWLSPVMAPLALVGLLVRRYRPLAIALAGYFAFIIAAWWLFTHRIDRFWVPALPLLALLAGLGAVWSVSLVWRRMVLTTVVIGLGISFIYVTSPELLSYNAYFISLPAARRDANRVNLWYLVLNDHVPPGSCVLSVGDAQVFDIEPPVLYNTVFDENLAAAIFEHRNAPQIAAELNQRRVSHVFVNWSEVYRYRQPGNYGGMPDFITPNWFAGLVQQGVLDMPWQHPLRPNQEVYPVKAMPAAAAHGKPLPLVPTAGTL